MSDPYIFVYAAFLASLLVLGLVMTARLTSKEHWPKVMEDEEDKRDMREHFKAERRQYRDARREARKHQTV